jgi:hypothetical protein
VATLLERGEVGGRISLFTDDRDVAVVTRLVITGAIKWGDAISVFVQLTGLRGHTHWPPP